MRRDGSLATVTDAAGTTTYGYSGTIASGESIQGGLLDGLTLSYPQTTGRRQGFTASFGPDTLSEMGYGYDTYGRLESVTDPGLGTNGFAAVFGYVPDSDLPYTTTSKVGDANGSTVLTGTRGYDAADRLTSIGYARPGNTVVTSHGYTLDDADRRTRADREDGTAWSYGYNDRDEKRRGAEAFWTEAKPKPEGRGPQAGGPSQVTSAIKLLPGEELLAGWQQTFDYDNLGNRKWTREGGDSAGANRRETVYTPNALNQYTSTSHPGAFDVLGRAPSDVSVTVNEQPVTRQGEFWRAELGGLPNALAAVWQPVQVDAVDPGAGPNGADLPARRSGHRFVPMATETPYYDFDGNLVADARWNYVWNGENQLIEVTTAAPALAAGVPRERYRYVYDSRSRRIARTVDAWDLDAGPSGDWVQEKNERFVYDDWNVVAVVDAAGAVVQRYAWGNDLSGTPQGAGGVGGLLAAADAASGRSWSYAYDGNGNVSAVVDLADGSKVGRYDYDAFGRTIASWGDEGLAGVNPYRFSTKPLEGTGLYYYGYRWYDAENGRWLGKDPIAESGGTNLYNFLENRVTDRSDRLGLDYHHWLIQNGKKEIGQAIVNSCTAGLCLCDIDMYTTRIDGQMKEPDTGRYNWGGSPHSILHNRFKYSKIYKTIASLTKGQPCKFYSAVSLMMEKYDKMLDAYGRDPGFDRGSYVRTGPALVYYNNPSFRTDFSWAIEAFRCCKSGRRDNSIYTNHIEKELVNIFEQEMLKRALLPPRRQTWNQIFDPSTALPSEPLTDDQLITIIIVGTLLSPIPGDEYVASAIGISRLSRIQGIRVATEGIFGPGKSTLLRNLPTARLPTVKIPTL